MAEKKTTKKRGRRLLLSSAKTLGRSMLKSLPGVDAERQWQKIGEDWFKTLGDMKGAAMKLGQMASQYQDVLPAPLAEQLSRLQSQSQPLSFSQLRPALDEYWNEQQWALIDEIDEQALASASIGQVHRARLRDGREVVLKIRYPEVDGAIDADLKHLARLIRMAGSLPVDKAGLDAVLAEIRARFIEEMDYAHELAALKDYLATPFPGVRYPQAIEALCGSGVLALEYLPADSIEQAKAYPQEVRNQIGERYTRWVIFQLFEQGRLHADPHPGNFGFHPDGQITVYDFGCTKAVSRTVQSGLLASQAAAIEKDWKKLHAALKHLGAVSLPYDKHPKSFEKIYADHCKAIMDPIMATEIFDYADPRILEEGRAATMRAAPHWKKFRIAADMTFVSRSLSGGYWLLRGLKAQVPLRQILMDMIEV